jgi:hypothetical protein
MTREEAIKEIKMWGIEAPRQREALETLIPELKETEDERIRKALINLVSTVGEYYLPKLEARNKMLAYLEKQEIFSKNGEGCYYYHADGNYTFIGSMGFGPIEDIKLNGERPKTENNSVDLSGACLCVEKQKEASKAIEAVDRIDKYIDEHLANAHDMKDSNPDKKYYRGWDDALGEMARILQDVYSGEKQKESLHISETCKESADSFTDEDERIRKWLYDYISNCPNNNFAFYGGVGKDAVLNYLEKQKEEEGYEEIPVESTLEYKLGFKAGKESEKQKEQEHICDSYQFEEGFKTGLEIGLRNQKEQKPIRDIISGDAIESCMLRYLQSAANRKDDIEIIEDTKKYKKELLEIIEKEQKPVEWDDDEMMCKRAIAILKRQRDFWSYDGSMDKFPPATPRKDLVNALDIAISYLEKHKLDASKLENFDPVDVLNRIKTEWPMAWEKVVGKQEWSEKDERIRKGLINFLRSSFIKENITDETVAPWITYLERQKPFVTIPATEIVKNEPMEMPSGESLDALADVVQAKDWKPTEKQKYDGNMDNECIKLCNTLNSIPSIDTFESCCGHLKDRYSIWFFCNDIITISRLGRCVERNYSDGKWELLVDSTDTHPTGVFCLRSKVPFQDYVEMDESVNELCNGIQYWFNAKFDSYFNARLGITETT